MNAKKVYLGGQWNEHDHSWKHAFSHIDGFEFYDPEVDSNQASPNTFFPDDLNAVKNAQIMIANPGLAPSEATWIEIGFFYATHVERVGETCENLIIVWQEGRLPKWSITFVEKAGHVVKTAAEAKEVLLTLGQV